MPYEIRPSSTSTPQLGRPTGGCRYRLREHDPEADPRQTVAGSGRTTPCSCRRAPALTVAARRPAGRPRENDGRHHERPYVSTEIAAASAASVSRRARAHRRRAGSRGRTCRPPQGTGRGPHQVRRRPVEPGHGRREDQAAQPHDPNERCQRRGTHWLLPAARQEQGGERDTRVEEDLERQRPRHPEQRSRTPRHHVVHEREWNGKNSPSASAPLPRMRIVTVSVTQYGDRSDHPAGMRTARRPEWSA